MDRGNLGQVLFFEENPHVKHTYKLCGESRVLPSRQALDVYANTPNPPSQVVFGYSEEELEEKKNEVVKRMQDPNWVTEYLEPML